MTTERGAPHWRVLDGVLADIRAGRYPPGGRLPSGSALGEEYAVYRSAASRAVEMLRWIGLVTGPPGGIARIAQEPRRSAALRLVDDPARLREMGDSASAEESSTPPTDGPTPQG
jgi:DNA-binding FadR family transcriptional regulator